MQCCPHRPFRTALFQLETHPVLKLVFPFHHIPTSKPDFLDDEASASPRKGHDGRRELLQLLSERSSRSSWLLRECEASQRQSSGRRPGVREVPLFSIWPRICQVARCRCQSMTRGTHGAELTALAELANGVGASDGGLVAQGSTVSGAQYHVS